jgi:SAM-dependent methyltransferase
MIIHKLIWRHLTHGDDQEFYRLQATDAVRWLEARQVRITDSVTALDLGCGHGIFGQLLAEHGCCVTYADRANNLVPELTGAVFRTIDLDNDDLKRLGKFDLVICSNVLEHLPDPARFLFSVDTLLNETGCIYLSWTNWLSPWGGHEFSPFHYLGPKYGHLVYDRWTGKARKHTPFVNLYPTSVGSILKILQSNARLQLVACTPRYYTELSLLAAIPGLREFLCWNCALLLRRSLR